jgi:anti-anti-sigma factor
VHIARRADGSAATTVRDRGTWRPAPSDPGYRGRGLTIVRELTRDTAVEPREGGGTEVRFRVVPADGEEPVSAPPDGDGDTGEDDVGVSEPGTAAGVSVVDEGDRRRLVVRGDLDLAAATVCREDLLGALAGPAHVEIDLRAVGYLASAGVGLVLEAVQTVRGRGGEATLRTVPGSSAARVLEIALSG